MPNDIQIKRSVATATPASLLFGELAFSDTNNTLFIGKNNGTVVPLAGPSVGAPINSPNFTGIPTAPTASDGTNNTQLATTAFVQSAITAILQGRDVKESCRVASTATINIASPGATIDGVTMVAGDRVLVKDQSTAAQNGIYVWNAAASAMTRATDANTNGNITSGMVVTVEMGTANADTAWFLSTDGPITIGTTSLTFVTFPGSGGLVAGAALQRNVNTLNVLVDSATMFINGSNQLAVRSSGTAGQTLISSGAVGTAPTWGALNLATAAAVTGILPISNGGMGRNSLVTGIVRGNAGAYAAAVAGTDYLDPDSPINGGTF